MAVDPDAREITLNYTGGSLTMTIGNAKDLFGEDSDLLVAEAETVTSEVDQHDRVRVIGGGITKVGGHTRSYLQWPTSQANNAAAGKKVLMTWEGSEGTWTGRAAGSMAALGSFLQASAAKAIVFRTARGTKYGPFASTNTP